MDYTLHETQSETSAALKFHIGKKKIELSLCSLTLYNGLTDNFDEEFYQVYQSKHI